MKSGRYLNWVKSQPCVVCGCEPAGDAHHLIGQGDGIMGGKVSDLRTFPLCRKHHDELHQDPKRWELIHGDQKGHILDTHDRLVFQGVLEVKA